MTIKKDAEFHCSNCGTLYFKWQGQCSVCHQWNSIVRSEKNTPSKSSLELLSVNHLAERKYSIQRYKTEWKDLDSILGGGLVSDSVLLIAGEPGIGKSTLLMQLMGSLSKNLKVAYISGEESVEQLSLHAKRLRISNDTFRIGMSQQLEDIVQLIQSHTYSVIVVDSIQTLDSKESDTNLGSISQIRMMTHTLIHMAKEHHCCLLIVGHITKEGQIAGPKTLEHMVDVVLYFEGDKKHHLRVLRSKKNRFGESSGIILFDMTSTGLHILENAHQYFLSDNKAPTIGSATFSTFEGGRSYFIEAQCLANPSFLPNPRRTAIGIDVNRLHMILALLDAHLHQSFSDQDVYVSLSGGFRTNDPESSLAIAVSLLSFKMQIPIPKDILFFGELALSGDIGKINSFTNRLEYFQKFGYNKVMLHLSLSKQPLNMTILNINHISQLPALLKKL